MDKKNACLTYLQKILKRWCGMLQKFRVMFTPACGKPELLMISILAGTLEKRIRFNITNCGMLKSLI